MKTISIYVKLCLVAQSCPTVCNPIDCSLPGFPVHGDSPGKNTGVGCHAFLQGIVPIQELNCRWIFLPAELRIQVKLETKKLLEKKKN